MEPYGGPYADHFVQAYRVDDGHEVLEWTRRNPVLANDDWQIEALSDTGVFNGDLFILAVTTPAGPVGFFASTKVDADRIRDSIS